MTAAVLLEPSEARTLLAMARRGGCADVHEMDVISRLSVLLLLAERRAVGNSGRLARVSGSSASNRSAGFGFAPTEVPS